MADTIRAKEEAIDLRDGEGSVRMHARNENLRDERQFAPLSGRVMLSVAIAEGWRAVGFAISHSRLMITLFGTARMLRGKRVHHVVACALPSTLIPRKQASLTRERARCATSRALIGAKVRQNLQLP